jgi:hypothetical protein
MVNADRLKKKQSDLKKQSDNFEANRYLISVIFEK